ncbi:MAG: toxin-antitoxin system, antitoxin component, Xre family protein [Gammaproteobacteria bacterium]
MQPNRIDDVVQKLRTLSSERIAEVEDFIDFLKQRDEDRQLTRAAMRATEPVLERIWDNADDAEYDRL